MSWNFQTVKTNILLGGGVGVEVGETVSSPLQLFS